MAVYDRNKPPSIVTGSPLKKWRLTKFKGYEVYAHKRSPCCDFLGQIWYRHSWKLVLSKHKDKSLY